MTMTRRLAAALASLPPGLPPVDTALILGSGLGGLAEAVMQRVSVPYAAIAGFSATTAPGHQGQLVFGRLHGRGVVVMQGRVHIYEGRQPGDIALAIYLLARLGAQRLIVTNAAGALNPAFRPGEVMAITDHLNFTGTNPLTGPNDPLIGPRFPDLSRAYDPDLLARLRAVARASGTALREGIYAGVAGPSLETSAERRFLRAAGADAVGMSTVHEVIAAAHVGLPCLGLSAITNAATGGPEQQPDSIEAVLANAAIAGARIAALLADLLVRL